MHFTDSVGMLVAMMLLPRLQNALAVILLRIMAKGYDSDVEEVVNVQADIRKLVAASPPRACTSLRVWR
mgnify:CR=1 FL=1